MQKPEVLRKLSQRLNERLNVALLFSRGKLAQPIVLFQVRFCFRNQSLTLQAHLLTVPFTPRTHLTQHRLHALPQFGQGIFDLWGYLCVDLPMKDASLL